MNSAPAKKYRGALFDLDGTLVDNYAAVHSCLAEVFAEFGIVAPGYDKVYRSVGGSILITIKRVMDGKLSDELAEAIGNRYMELFPRHIYNGLKPMPFARGILESLDSAGVKLACFTNKQQPAAEDILKRLGMYGFFDVVAGTTLLSARKPEARFTISALESLGLGAGECVGIGDSPYDYSAARSVSMDSAIVATGADSFESLKERCPSAIGIFKDLKELAGVVFGITL